MHLSTPSLLVKPEAKHSPPDWPVFEPIPGRSIDHIVIEDDEPVDNFPQEKSGRMLPAILYHSDHWLPPDVETFIVANDVGMFPDYDSPGRAPDVFVSLNVEVNPDFSVKENRTYLFWNYHKPPEFVLEIVSNRKGGEMDNKILDYAAMGIDYYAIYDPDRRYFKAEIEDGILEPVLRSYELVGSKNKRYRQMNHHWYPKINLGLCLWEGEHERVKRKWLRWCDVNGVLLPTADEAAEAQELRAEAERERAEAERERAEAESQRAKVAEKRESDALERAEAERQRAEASEKRERDALNQAEAERQRAAEQEAEVRKLRDKLRSLELES